MENEGFNGSVSVYFEVNAIRCSTDWRALLRVYEKNEVTAKRLEQFKNTVTLFSACGTKINVHLALVRWNSGRKCLFWPRGAPCVRYGHLRVSIDWIKCRFSRETTIHGLANALIRSAIPSPTAYRNLDRLNKFSKSYCVVFIVLKMAQGLLISLDERNC